MQPLLWSVSPPHPQYHIRFVTPNVFLEWMIVRYNDSFQDWGVAEQYMASLMDYTEIHKIVYQVSRGHKYHH